MGGHGELEKGVAASPPLRVLILLLTGNCLLFTSQRDTSHSPSDRSLKSSAPIRALP